MKRWIMVLALVCSCGMVAFAQKATEASIIVFGEAKATKERIDKGATFIDGRFIRGPYTVTRQGNVILVNGQPAAHLKIEIAKEETPEEDVVAPSADADAASDEEAVEADASEATDAETPEVTLPPTRTLTRAEKEAAAKEKADAMFKRNGHKTLKEKEAERKKAATAKPKPAFNQEASSSNPDALFEEADYTFTPPKKAEPKAVPYVRPSATKSLKERLAEEEAAKAAKKAAEAAAKAEQTAAKAATATTATSEEVEPAEEEIAEDPADLESEAIGMLSEDEAKRYVDELKKRHKAIEDALQKDQLVFLSSSAWGWKASPKAVMQKFILSLEKPGKWDAFSKQWKSLPQQYLRKIYDQREENSKNSKALRLKIQRDQREAKDKPSRV